MAFDENGMTTVLHFAEKEEDARIWMSPASYETKTKMVTYHLAKGDKYVKFFDEDYTSK